MVDDDSVWTEDGLEEIRKCELCKQNSPILKDYNFDSKQCDECYLSPKGRSHVQGYKDSGSAGDW